MIAQHLHDLLTAALPDTTPVLLPEQVQEPLSGGKPGQPSGLRAYLQAHAGGYVQVEEPQGITSDGLTASYWVPVASLAPTAEACAQLAAQVALTLNGTPHLPGPHPEVTPSMPALLQSGAWMCRPTYHVLTLAGAVASG
ncbi:hypothetical protein [Deinococcus kurensis]|uniref:hypothetical protein n=1 Tax=Deinococcus kurensis TaxID=2662757 RepID=UPI0012D32853|nr:hypothetical protein [Deinococcus kurensis]